MFKHDWELGIWHHTCGACGTSIAAATITDLRYAWNQHTHGASCLGGY